MTKHAYAARLAGLGAVALGLTLAGCGGMSTPLGGSASPSLAGGQGISPTAVSVNQDNDMSGVAPDKRKHHHHGGSCIAVTLTQHFNGQAIPKGAWMLFTSVAQFPGNPSALRVEMKDSKIYFFDNYHNKALMGPNMTETIGAAKVRLKFNGGGGGGKFGKGGGQGGWTMSAPSNTGGNNFLDDVVVRVPHSLPGNLQNVTWSAKFYSRDDIQQMHWQWGAAMYTKLSTNYQRLGVKALDGNKYPPFNNDPAGTPERYKGWYDQQGGGTGGQQYTGVGGPNANVTPCL